MLTVDVLETTIKQYADEDDPTMRRIGIAQAAHAIAEAHEAEVASLQPRLALMAEALRELSEHGLCGIDEIRWEVYAQADKALAAAPKVLWSGEAKWSPEESLPGRIDLVFKPSRWDHGSRIVVGVGDITLRSGDKMVRVIVLDPSEQPPESEQSAILPCGHHADNAEWRAVCRECEKED